MTDDPAPANLLLFTPVAALRVTRAGWLPEVQREFIRALARLGNVSAAARGVGRSPRSAWQLLRRAGADSSFAQAWDHALMLASEFAHGPAIAALHEPERLPVVRRGQIVGWRERPNYRLLGATLRTCWSMQADMVPAHEVRILRRQLYNLQRAEAAARLGPVQWPDPTFLEPEPPRPRVKSRPRPRTVEEERAAARRSPEYHEWLGGPDDGTPFFPARARPPADPEPALPPATPPKVRAL